MSELKVECEIELLSPMHVGTGLGLARLVDELTVRGPLVYQDPLGSGYASKQQPTPYLPASSLKGRLRVHLSEVAEAVGISVCAPRAGTRCTNTSNGEPCPACLLFGAADVEGALRLRDAHLSDPGLAMALPAQNLAGSSFLMSPRHFVAISRLRGVARPQQLATIQQVDAGSTFLLEGRAYLEAPHPDPARHDGGRLPVAAALLTGALLSLTHVGGHKARGLGYVRLRCRRLEWGGAAFTPEEALTALLSNTGGAA